MKDNKNKKIAIAILVIGVFFVIVGVFYIFRTDSSMPVEVKLNKKKKIHIDRAGKAVFKFTPEEDGYYGIDWHEFGVEEEEPGDSTLYENMKKKIEFTGRVYYFKKGNDYYLIDDMSHCLDYGYDCSVSFEVKDYAYDTITENNPVTINEDTVLEYKSSDTEMKTMTVDNYKNIYVQLEYKNLSEDSLIAYRQKDDKYYFGAKKDDIILIVCDYVTKKTKLTIETTPDVSLWDDKLE